MSLVNGVVIGLVTNVNDDGTVKVKFPWLPDDPETDWIRIATTMAGNDRGTFFMPEEKDEVLVAFEHGDTNYPYVVGFLWNGKDKPPETDKSVRRIKTKTGHTIEFNDNSGEERIHIKTAGKHEIELKDGEHILLKTKDGQEVNMDDTSSSITIKTSGGQEVAMEPNHIGIKTGLQKVDMDSTSINISAIKSVKSSAANGLNNIEVGPMEIKLNVPMGRLSIQCLQAEINATTLLTINAPLTIFNGAIQAQAVIGSAYTFAVPGNLLGL